MEDEVTWEPTGLADNIIVGFSAAHQLVILVTVLHLSWTFKWPPYVVRNVTLVCTTGIAGACWAVVIVSSFGMYKREEGSLWAQCDLEIFMSWMSVGLLSNAGFIRIYRHWKLLQMHDRKMWLTEYQLALLMVPFLIPNVLYFIQPDLIRFDAGIQECVSKSTIVTPLIGLWCISLLLLALYLVHSMRHLRKQFHEYFLIRRVAILVLLAPTMFIFIDTITGPEHGALRRRLEVVLSISITGLMFWIPIYKPVWAFITKDEEYLDLYTHGFFELPTPAQLRASLDGKVTIEELRREFRRYAKTRVPKELVQFYTDVLERDTVENYFERQAVTMKIIDRYVRSGSPDEVSLTDGCWKRVMESDVTRLDIFEEARLEVLKIMEDALQRDIEAAPGYERFRAEVEGQAKERLFLIGSGILPAASTPQCSPRRRHVELTPVRVSSPTSDTDGSLCYSSDGHVYSSSSSEGPSLYSSGSCRNTPHPPGRHGIISNQGSIELPPDSIGSIFKPPLYSRSLSQAVGLDASTVRL